MDVKRRVIIVCIIILRVLPSCAQTFLFSSSLSEQLMSAAFHRLYIQFESALKNHQIKIFPYGFNELKYSDSCSAICGIEMVESKEGVSYKNHKLSENEILFSAVMNKGDRTNERLTDLLRWNVSVREGKELKHFAIINAEDFRRLADSIDLRLFSAALNYSKLYDKKLYSKYTLLCVSNLKDYSFFIPFSLNMRMRNLALHQSIPIYNQCVPWYDKDAEKYLLIPDTLQALWENDLLAHASCADTTYKLSGFGITESDPGKNTCVRPVIGYHQCLGNIEPVYGGFIPWKAFSNELTEDERFTLNYILTQKRKLHLH